MRALRIALLAACFAAGSAAACPALFNHTFNSLVADQPVDFCQYAGKVVLVVNTASNCGYTPQYKGLESLYRRFKGKGLVIVGFPANDFGGQEPAANSEIARFCEENYGVSFPMFSKAQDGKPLPANPLYARLIAATGRAPGWNFHKYLIDRSGKVTSFDSAKEPEGKEVLRAVQAALAG